MPKPPLIAVSPNHLPAEARRLYQGKPLEYGEAHLAASIATAGGVPVLAYRAEQVGDALVASAEMLMDRVDGLVLSGGQDIAPETYGARLQDPGWAGDPLRDAFELALYRAALAAQKPVLGVCRGAQLIGVAEGGTLWQDLSTLRGAHHDTLVHRDQARYDALDHDLVIAAEDVLLSRLFGVEPQSVNSVHHQALDRIPDLLRVLASAPDGVPECYVRDDAWVLAVQWHPEWMQDRQSQRALFSLFIDAASGRPAGLPW